MRAGLWAIVVLATLPVSAQAIERVRTDQTSCAAIQSVIERRGEAILRTPSSTISGLILFGRYVRDDAQCERGQEAVGKTIQSADQARCRVKQCEEIDPLLPLFDR